MPRFCKLLILIISLPLVGAAWAVEEIPVEDFFKRSPYSSFQLSPDGKYLAAISPIRERRNIAVIDLETRQARAVTGVTDRDVNGFMWANDDRLLFFMDKDGNESFGIFAVNRDGKKAKTLVEPAETQIKQGSFVVRTAFVLNRLENDPDRVLVAIPRLSRNRVIQDVKTMDIRTGRQSIVERNPGNIAGWLTNDDGDVIGALQLEDGKRRVLHRPGGQGDWNTLVEFEDSNGGFTPAWISDDGKRMLIRSNVNPDGTVRDKAAIYEYDFLNNQIGRLVFEHPDVDVGGVMSSDVTDEPTVVYFNAAKPGYHFLDAEWQAIWDGIQAAFPGRMVSATSLTEDERKFVFAVWDDRNPADYYLYNRDSNQMEELAQIYDWLPEDSLARTEPVTIEARDGLQLPAYLTLPPGSDGKNLPMVLNVHGGPWARDSWGFNPEVQLMANRGYAVLQVNFRGSTGYGQDFRNASRKQWGLKMQDDLTDAVHWAVETGVADPDRVCIYGGSYGGYAAMAGATFTPDLYQCAINYVGVTDINLLFETMPASWELLRKEMIRDVGDPEKDKELLADRSPINHVDKIQVPILMAYGRQDPRVVLEHALSFEKQLKLHEKDYELIIKNKEGHGFRKFENQVEWYTKVIDFLDANLNGHQPENQLDRTSRLQ
jgi:dipeptidyl aminopeptidase/acylaminoacyl peptidase